MVIDVPSILSSLFNANDKVCFRVFDDRKEGTFKGAKLSCECGKYKSIEEELQKHNAKNRGIFFVVNYGGDDDKTITRINAQFVEMDDGSFEEQMAKIEAFPLPPSMIIRTRKSYHVYWFMEKDAKVERFRAIQTQLVRHFDGDPMCVNESRVMRLPGFMHSKKEPVEVVCVSFHPERKYTQDELSEVLPDVDLAPVERRSGEAKGLEHVMRMCDFMKHCQEDAATLSEHDWYAMITNLAAFEGGTEMIHKLSSPYPGYSENNTQRKINHFLESKTSPITCKTIHEKGYKCPKLEKGECPVKSPAAWCYQPLSIDALREILSEMPVTADSMKDMDAAKEFVILHLYNQDVVIATAMINIEIKKHFKFTTSLLKPLLSAYKDASKAYNASKGTKRAKMGSSVPLWYQPTDWGLKFMPTVLAKHMAESSKIIFAAEQHFIYQGGVYEEMAEMEAQKLVQDKMLITEAKMTQILDTEKQWRLMVRKDIRELNANPYIINIRNGLYNVLEDTLLPHSPDYYSTVQMDVSYDKDADCPRFKKFLEESMEGDMAQVRLIQEMMGYFLIPVNSAQKCFVIVGAAGAGKSVLLRVLNEVLLGKRNVSNVSWQALNERFKTAELFGKLANIFADLPTKNIDDNGIFKALVGEDYLTVEKKNKNPFSFQSTARLLFSCNSIPRNYGDKSEGFYRRLIIIRFKHAVPEEKRKANLVDDFREEADGIFMFALEGLKRLMKQGYKFSETDVNAKELQRYREESDSVLAFVREYCERGAGYITGSTELYNAYKSYCEESGMKPYAHKNVVQQILAAFPDVSRDIDRVAKRRILKGIRIGEVLG